MKYFGIAAKALLLVGLVVLLAPRIDLTHSLDLLWNVRTLSVILLASLILTAQSAMAAVRQSGLIALLGSRVSFWPSFRVWLLGLFISQVLITFIAGDVARGVQLMKEGVPRRTAGRAVVLDRVLGLVALLFLVILAVPFVLEVARDPTLRLSLYLMAASAASGIMGFFATGLIGRFMHWLPGNLLRYRLVEVAVDLISVARFAVRAPVHALSIFAISVLMHLLNVVCIILITRALGQTVPALSVGAVTIPVLLLSMLPISFAGWGVREAAMITGLGLLGVPASVALATSLAFGLSVIIASLPGIAVLARTGSLRLVPRTRNK